MAAHRMQKQSFRRATPADAGIVREITRAAYSKWIPVIGREPKPMTTNYVQAVADHVIDLFDEAGRPIALIEVIPKRSHLLLRTSPPCQISTAKALGACFSSVPRPSRDHSD
jgi:hypothetical protein